MAEKEKKPLYKKKIVWVIAVIVVIAIGASASKGGGNQANETTKSTNDSTQQQPKKSTEKPRLTLNNGWSIDTSNPYITQVVGAVSNNSDQDIKGYIQITFSALDVDGANVGDCMANANTVDAGGKWKFKAVCSGDDIKDVRFKELTGF